MGSEANGADVNLKVPGGEVNLRNVKSLNTLATVATLIFVCAGICGGYLMLTAHASETKDAGREFVQALKEVAQSLRENNCLTTFTPEKREANADMCKRLSR